jgi:hypothetical protein
MYEMFLTSLREVEEHNLTSSQTCLRCIFSCLVPVFELESFKRVNDSNIYILNRFYGEAALPIVLPYRVEG